MKNNKTSLFIYGSLRDRRVFQSVCGLRFSRRASKLDGQTLFAEPAFLPGHRRVSPDNVYYYAVAAPSARIEGLVIHDIPDQAMAEIDRYEGKRYQRELVRVNTAYGSVEAQAYLASVESMRKHFGDRFHVNLIHELWLRRRIERFIKRHTRPGERTLDAELERLAERELLATTERDLVMSHYHTDAVSDYYLARELDRPRPSIRHLDADPAAQPFLRSYRSLVFRQVLLNRLDEEIQLRYRFELEHMRTSERYYARSVSLLAALLMINANPDAVDLLLRECFQSLSKEPQCDLIDYVKYAVRASRIIFDSRVARAHLDRIRSNLQAGLVPLGFELELSNQGAAAVEPQRSIRKTPDPVYDGFRYFYDFRLDVLSWKLGGYIDDHTGSTDRGRRCGFLEVAPGRLNIAGELSRPATADPWLLNQLIHELVKFYPVAPHSLHLSFQLRKKQIGRQRVLPFGFVKCLLALGGGPERRTTGRLWVSRLQYDEITQYREREELVFARTSNRNWYLGGDGIADRAPTQARTSIQQYKFIRLDERANYEPLIVCLKGLQLAYNPGDYLSADQLRNPRLRRQLGQVKRWAAEPTPIAPQVIGRFLNTVHQGLIREGFHGPVHNLHYIDWAVDTIRVQLHMFNQQINHSIGSA